MEALIRMKQLIARLNEASKAYYQDDREIMSNLEYDALYDELEALESSTDVHMAGSPTAKVGYEVLGSLVKVPHETPMLSLDKTKEITKLVDFLDLQEGLLSWKLDGLTVVLRYEDGGLVQAVTRGNGMIGEDVTHTARVFVNVPLRIPFKGRLVLRGEAVIGNADFEKINDTIDDPDERYKNPRNLCSGTVRQLNSETAAKRHVRFYAFGIVKTDNPPFLLKSAQLAWLVAQGFETVEWSAVKAETVADAVADFQNRITKQDIASDGLVLTYDSIPYSETLGSTSKFPRDAIAFKWTDELSETTLLHIEWNTSRTGSINPIAVFEPVEIEGTTVNKASLHNVSIVKSLALGEGDRITVYKANMIIPQVAENLTRSGTIAIPEQCPVCHSETEIAKVREGEILYCLNPNCRAQLISGLDHFTSRDAMNIEGLSEQTLEKLVAQGMVVDYTDIFDLERYESAIVQMEGFGKRSFQKLMTSVEKAKDVPLPNFIYALGIKHVGLSNAKLLCTHYSHDLERIIQAAREEAYAEELAQIKGFGEVISRSLHVYFTDEKNVTLLNKALTFIRFQKPQEDQTTDKLLSGLVFVITGDVKRFANRKAMQSFIEQLGGRCTGSVTAKTSFLINNDAGSPSSKNKSAQALGIPILTEDEWLERFDLQPLLN